MCSHSLNSRHSGGDFSKDAAFGVRSFRAQFWVPSAAALSAPHFQKSDQGSQKMRVDASDISSCSRVPHIAHSSLLQLLHSCGSLSELFFALPAQISPHGTGSAGTGPLRRPGRETALGRCRPPNFWQKCQILDAYPEVLMIIQKQHSPIVPFWSVTKLSVCLQLWGMLRPRTTSSLLLSPSYLKSQSFTRPTPHSPALYLEFPVPGLQLLEQGEHSRMRRNSKRESLALPLPLGGEACKAHEDAYV